MLEPRLKQIITNLLDALDTLAQAAQQDTPNETPAKRAALAKLRATIARSKP